MTTADQKTPPSYDVFVSYASEDKQIADAVVATLESNRIRCWIAPRDVLPGLNWAGAIVDAINQSRLMVLVYSSRANQSTQISREVERAANKGIPILPFRIEDAPPSKDMEYFISTSHWLDALTPPLERHLQHLTETVRLILQRVGGPGEEPPAQPVTPESGLQRRRTKLVISAGITAAVLVAIVVIVVVFGRQKDDGVIADLTSSSTQNVASSNPSAQSLPVTALPLPERGALVFQAKLDGTADDVVLPRWIDGDPSASDIKFVPGAIEQVILKQDGGTGVPLNSVALLRYLVEFELAYKPGSEVSTDLDIRYGTDAQDAAYVIRIDAFNEYMELVYQPYSPAGADEERLTSRILIPGLQTGKTFILTAIVDQGRYILLLDDKQVADVADTRLDEPSSPSIYTSGVKGTLFIRGVRIYRLQ